MRNKNLVAILLSITILFGGFPAKMTFALDSDLNYDYITKNTEEFVLVGKTNLNFNGEIPDYLRDIYDISPQTVYDSEYGANIIVPDKTAVNSTTYAPRNAPVSAYTTGSAAPITGAATSSASGSISSGVAGGVSDQIPETTYGDSALQYPLTTVEQVRNNDGSIGVLRIPKIDLEVTAYDGDTFTAMQKGIGHIASTSCWNGTIGLVGHNRGVSDYFGKLKKLKVGDEITYETRAMRPIPTTAWLAFCHNTVSFSARRTFFGTPSPQLLVLHQKSVPLSGGNWTHCSTRQANLCG